MFERFTEPARHVVLLAQDAARELRHDHVGTEHLLLGLLREQRGFAARLLGSLGVGLEDVTARIAPGEGELRPTGQIQLTDGARRTLEGALREVQSLGHGAIGTEHLLLGLTRSRDEDIERLLAGLGVTPDAIRSRVIAAFSGDGPD